MPETIYHLTVIASQAYPWIANYRIGICQDQMISKSQEIIRTLSSEKLRRFLQQAANNLDTAQALYLWNVRCSAHLFSGLHLWEIGARNRIDAYLRTLIGAKWTEEYEDSVIFQEYQKGQIYKARKKLKRINPRGLNHSAVIAELTAGFWISMLSNQYSLTLKMDKNLSQIVPYSGGIKRKMVHAQFERHLRIRNRIAHHEHMLGYDINTEWLAVGESIGWICPSLYRMFASLPDIAPLAAIDPRRNS
jgi:hypothetical protein